MSQCVLYLGGASAAQNSAPAPPVDTSGVAQTTDNPLFKSAGAELTGDDSDSAAHGSGVGGGVATGGGAPIAVRATAKVAEAEMVAAGRATLPFRICMLILLRALDLQASACHQVPCRPVLSNRATTDRTNQISSI